MRLEHAMVIILMYVNENDNLMHVCNVMLGHNPFIAH